MTRLRPIGHDDRLSIVDHLDELRSRLIVCLAALVVAFGLCFWQNNRLLTVLNRALPHNSSVAAHNGLGSVPSEAVQLRRLFTKASRGGHGAGQLTGGFGAGAAGLPPGGGRVQPDREDPAGQHLHAGEADHDRRRRVVHDHAHGRGVLRAAVLFTGSYLRGLCLCDSCFELNRAPCGRTGDGRGARCCSSRRAAFTYLVVLPPAVHFLQGYNADQFDVLVQAKSYYSFQILTMLAVGLAFQLPLGLLGLHRVGAINGSTLTRHWRYATVIIAVIAAAMPGADPVTTGLETAPLVILFLASIVLLKIADRRAAARAAARGECLLRRRPRSHLDHALRPS